MTLERPRFATTKLREGYDMGDVDDAIDRVFNALAEPVPSMSAQDVRTLRFTPVRLREGYDMGEVDQWLDEAAAELGRAETARGTTSVEASAPAEPAHDTTTRSDAIVEVPSRGPWFAVLALALLVVAIAVVYVVG